MTETANLEQQNRVMRDLLTALLKCGWMDLDILLDCQYDFDELVDDFRDNFGATTTIDVNNLAYAMFDKGKSEIRQFIEDRIETLKDEDELSEEEQQELDALQGLEPYEDIESFHNFIDTSVYFSDNQELYEKYCSEALDTFTKNTGFSLT